MIRFVFIKNFCGSSIENRLEMILVKYGILYMYLFLFFDKIYGYENNVN